MPTIPKQTLVQKIDAVEVESYPRPHLGASLIGSPCKRSVVYSFYWANTVKVQGRLERIYRMGDAVEDLIVNALSSIGIEVSGSQNRVTDATGHAGGSIDGVAVFVPELGSEKVLFEGKSMNHNNFMEVKRKGVQASKPTHYVQMQMYMGRLDLRFALYVVMDKNDSNLYTEIVPFDEECFLNHVDLEDHVLHALHIEEFPRISTNPSWYVCKMCDFKDACQHNAPVKQNCRTCETSYMEPNGVWVCGMTKKMLTVEEQQEGCGAFELSEMWS